MSTTTNEGITENEKNLFQVSILNMKIQNEEKNIYKYDHDNTNPILYYDVFDFSSKITYNQKKVLLYIFRKVFEKALTDGKISDTEVNDYKKYNIETQGENIEVSEKEEQQEEDDEEMQAMQARIAALRSEGGDGESTDIFYYKHNKKDENLKVIQMSLLDINDNIVSKNNYIVDYGALNIDNTKNVQNILKIMTEVFKIKISNKDFLNMINYQNIINDNTKKNFYNNIDGNVEYFEKNHNDINLDDTYIKLLSEIQKQSHDYYDTILKIQTKMKGTMEGTEGMYV